MTRLGAADFDAFFGELHRTAGGRPLTPFPWQRRLVRRVLGEDGGPAGWPRVLALPTASGKTAAIDIAVFTLACGAGASPGDRVAPRRIFFVVDRRVIVDEAFERARRLAAALAETSSGVLLRVADRLRELAGGGPSARPLEAFELRGGIYRDGAWARTPLQPTVIASTVDQIGSRLLYRGYGVSSKSWPIHAGLAAHDALVILDEAHCARPFSETLEAVRRYRTWAEVPLPAPFVYVEMSATPRPGLADSLVFDLEDEDRADPELGRRLSASKPAALLPPVTGKSGSVRLIETLCSRAEELARGGARRIALLVNRVDTARQIHRRLDPDLGDKVLMIGRMRPWDRDRLLERWRGRLAADLAREELERPVFVAATQCLEVGANLDFDALVTECASLDALRQRFGRLNRLGRDEQAEAAIAVAADDLKAGQDDPVYGSSLRETWRWLSTAADAETGAPAVDLGILAADARWQAAVELEPDLRERLTPPAPRAPVILPSHLDLWAQTAPAPAPEPDVSLFLHGPDRGAPEVQICWRADLELPVGEPAVEWSEVLPTWIDTVALVPPSSSECMSVPLHVVVRWLRGEARPGADLADVEGSLRPEESAAPRTDAPEPPRRAFLRWRGPDDSAMADLDHPPRPGETLVIPAHLGGWDELGHIPEDERGRVPADVAEAAHLARRRRALLRLHPALLERWPESESRDRLLELVQRDEPLTEPGELTAGVLDALATLDESERPVELDEVIDEMLHRGFDPAPHPAGLGWVLHGKLRPADLDGEDGPAPGLEAELYTTDDDSASATTEVRLTSHCAGVAELAKAFAAGCGLAEKLSADLHLAGRLHDLGKADPRFQAWLYGGNALAAELAPHVLAKSRSLPESRLERERARRRAGYPSGSRHELLSVRLAESAPEALAAAADRDLVLHLIASHHGHCRPFAPVIDDDSPVEVRVAHGTALLTGSSATGLEALDSGVADRYWRLVRRYGWWGLALLEAILRLADHRCSESEERRAHQSAAEPAERRSA